MSNHCWAAQRTVFDENGATDNDEDGLRVNDW